MDLAKLTAKRAKLDERIRKFAAREREQRQRNLLKLAKKHGLLQLDAPSLETALAKVAGTTESVTSSDTAAPAVDAARTPTTETGPETVEETPKKKWGWQ
jgi:hypothetical protein